MNHRNSEKRRKSDWFHCLSQADKQMLEEVLEECAEFTAACVFNLVDGVGGDCPGVFEIVAVSQGERTVLNPENSDLLHDLFSEVCEGDRRRRNGETAKELDQD